MEASLENAIDVLRLFAEGYLTDELDHLHIPADDAWRATRIAAQGPMTEEHRRQYARLIAPMRVIEFLSAAGQIEDDKLTDHLGRVINRQMRLKPRQPNEASSGDAGQKLTALQVLAQETDLAFRTRAACDQITRYRGAVASPELAYLLDELADLNEEMHHGRSEIIIRARIEAMKAGLFRLATVECP